MADLVVKTGEYRPIAAISTCRSPPTMRVSSQKRSNGLKFLELCGFGTMSAVIAVSRK
jgi:hypothetical protein